MPRILQEPRGFSIRSTGPKPLPMARVRAWIPSSRAIRFSGGSAMAVLRAACDRWWMRKASSTRPCRDGVVAQASISSSCTTDRRWTNFRTSYRAEVSGTAKCRQRSCRFFARGIVALSQPIGRGILGWGWICFARRQLVWRGHVSLCR